MCFLKLLSTSKLMYYYWVTRHTWTLIYYNKTTLENCGCYSASSIPQGPFHPSLCSNALMSPWLLNWWLLSTNCRTAAHRLVSFKAVISCYKIAGTLALTHTDLKINKRGRRTWLWKLKTSSLWPFPPHPQNTSPNVMHIHLLLWVMPALFFPLLKQMKTCFMLDWAVLRAFWWRLSLLGAHPAQRHRDLGATWKSARAECRGSAEPPSWKAKDSSLTVSYFPEHHSYFGALCINRRCCGKCKLAEPSTNFLNFVWNR